ncbi:MAG TPA: sodium ion-translocating decarboxylase subunit beta [Flexilinea sp.]|nr:sodium ion-translocating decarboxylase subunit beta [Flexilinea sp.]
MGNLGSIVDTFYLLSWREIVMIIVGLVLIGLAIFKEYEPTLLLPIGFGCVLANLGMSAYQTFTVTEVVNGQATEVVRSGFLKVLYDAGITTELFPLLIFVGVGAMIDFRPLLAMPKMVILGAAGQFGIYGTLLLASFLAKSFPGLHWGLAQTASIGTIGAIDGPTAIYVTSKIAPNLLGPIAVAAYSYMSLIPIIQPPIMKALSSKEDRKIRMEYAPREVSDRSIVVFPMLVTIIISIISPAAAPLIAALMLGNLLKESGVVDRLDKAAQNEIINVSTLFLGLAVGGTMIGSQFLTVGVLFILVLGLLAFVLDTVFGMLFGQFMKVITGRKINPLIGACGISAFPMAGRIAAKLALEEDPDNFILMHAMGANTAGQLGSVIAGGVLLALVQGFL